MTDEYPPKQRSDEARYLREIRLSKIEEIAWWCMAVIETLRILIDMDERIETVAREYDDIILAEYLCIPEKSPLQHHMS